MKRIVAVASCVAMLPCVGMAATKSASSLARVVAVETKSNDVQELMDVKMWEFDVRLPAGAKSSKQLLVLEQRRRGRAPERLLRVPLSSFPDTKRLSISIGLYPPDGDVMHSKKLKYRFRTSFYGSDGKPMPSFTLSSVIANPFDNMTATYPSGGSKAIAQKGGFLLFGGSKSSNGWPRQTMDDILHDNASSASFDAALVFAIR